MNITGKTIQLGVIGNPVEHSISPQLHNTMIENMGLDYTYSAFKVSEEDIEKAIDGMRALNIRGLNVTIPHKIRAAELCDEIDSFAEKMGAVNTLVNTKGVIKGYNTDGPGFVRSLLREGVEAKDKTVAILGAGGAAQGVAMALASSGAKEIIIVNRTYEKAQNLAEKINAYYPDVAFAGEGFTGVDILVNTTSVGMNSDISPVDFIGDGVKEGGVVCDVVYCPRETALLKMAKEKGLKTVGGIGMLINQAVIAFELFTGKAVDKKTIDYLYAMTELNTPIILTGFMGTGKSSVAKELCRLTGGLFTDTDAMIESETGMKISDIFKKFGEEHFRNLESDVIRRVAGKKGAVISLGGGAVIRRENIDLLRKTGLVFCLNADIERVFKNIGGKTESRPLLDGKSIDEARELLNSRKEAYENCDFSVDVTDKEKKETASYILNLYMNRILKRDVPVGENIELVKGEIEEAKKRSGREDEVTLIAVTKTVDEDRMQKALDAHIDVFGENRVQELVRKMELFPSVHWHLIGHLQKNKVKYVVGKAELIHSVDSMELLGEIDRIAKKRGIVQDVLLEVNISGEKTKYGLTTEEIKDIMIKIGELQAVRVRGIMTMAPKAEDNEIIRPVFRRAKELFDFYKKDYPSFDTLSMGMSGDYTVAVEEGATIIRVGSLIFGKRNY